MIKGFLEGIGLAFGGFPMIVKKGIRPFVVVPLLINIAVFSLGIWLAYAQFSGLMEQMMGWLPGWLPDFIKTALEYVLWPLFAVLILMLIYFRYPPSLAVLWLPYYLLLAFMTSLGESKNSTCAGISAKRVITAMSGLSHLAILPISPG